MEEVRYQEIAGFPGYRVGDDGSVWSCRRPSGVLAEKWHALRVYRRPYGARYCVVCFRPLCNGRVVQRYVHRLVLEAFVGPCPDGMQGCHNDGNSANNHRANLRWDTITANHRDKHRHGTALIGSRSPSAKFREEDVFFMLTLRESGSTVGEISEVFGMDRNQVNAILRGARWKHVYEAWRNKS